MVVHTRSTSRAISDSAGRVDNTNTGAGAAARRAGRGASILESVEADVEMAPRVHTRSSSARAAGDRPSVPPVESFAYGSPSKAVTPDPLGTQVPTQAPGAAIDAGIWKARKRQTKTLTAVDEKDDGSKDGEENENVDDGDAEPSGTQGQATGTEPARRTRALSGRSSRSPTPAHSWLPAWIPSWDTVMDVVWTMMLLTIVVLVSTVAWKVMTAQPEKPYLPQQQNTTANFPDNGIPLASFPSVSTSDYKYLSSRIEYLENAYRSLAFDLEYDKQHEVNYFSAGLGAVVNPYLTSPTKQIVSTLSWKKWFIYSAFRLNLPVSPPPIEALGPWDDIGDCWCAPRNAENSGGKLQLAVLLPRTITPTELVIEHIPKGATLDSGSAPRGIELWAQINDPMKREAVTNAMFSLLPYEETQPSELERNADRFQANRALDESWIRIGMGRYDLFGKRHIQTLRVPIDLEHFGVKTNQVAVRVVSNWGDSDHVCLYRLKLHGHLKEEDPKYRDSAPTTGMHDPDTATLTMEV
ncbi:MAG: hypothetical protein Q9187_002509 [Circinaria calcarea]